MARHLWAFFAIPDRKLRLTVKNKMDPMLVLLCRGRLRTVLAISYRFWRPSDGPTVKKRTLCWSYSAKAAYALFSRSQIALGGRQLVLKDVYFRTRWGAEEYKRGMKALEEVFPFSLKSTMLRERRERGRSDLGFIVRRTPIAAAVWELLSDGRSKLRPAGGTGSGRSFR
ncbi:hypothetical protein K438DRAFT_1756111 [Mycena galopus ATCC 62051]|nr:hypothetical protein K438DRAFT_1756111 [Mycena galopus ATCC 62051]